MDYKRLCESDYRFMCVIWEHAPLSSTELVALCREELGWKKSTTYTMLKKLCEKGLAQNENATVTALISKDQVQTAESTTFVNQTFGGSLPSFLTAFFGGKPISEQEANELKDLIDRYREG